MSSRLAAGALVFAVCAGIAWHLAGEAGAAPPERGITPPEGAPKDAAKLPAVEEWAGKVVVVTTDKFGAALENVRIRQVGNRSFFVGKAVDDGDKSYTAGRVVWIAVDGVTNIVEFPSVKEYIKAAEEARRALPAAVPAAPAVPAVPVS
jgi:hypothetical protein